MSRTYLDRQIEYIESRIKGSAKESLDQGLEQAKESAVVVYDKAKDLAVEGAKTVKD